MKIPIIAFIVAVLIGSIIAQEPDRKVRISKAGTNFVHCEYDITSTEFGLWQVVTIDGDTNWFSAKLIKKKDNLRTMTLDAQTSYNPGVMIFAITFTNFNAVNRIR